MLSGGKSFYINYVYYAYADKLVYVLFYEKAKRHQQNVIYSGTSKNWIHIFLHLDQKGTTTSNSFSKQNG